MCLPALRWQLVVAIPLGILMGVWWPAKAIVDPFVSLLRPLPSITWIPLTMLWLGIGESQKVAIVFMGSWLYILLATLEATKQVDPLLIRAARNLGANDLAIMREVILPGALPGILRGSRSRSPSPGPACCRRRWLRRRTGSARSSGRPRTGVIWRSCSSA